MTDPKKPTDMEDGALDDVQGGAQTMFLANGTPVRADTQTAGREDQIEVIATNYQIKSPRDAASGLPTGKRMHKPVSG